jgi:hypothetical protein
LLLGSMLGRGQVLWQVLELGAVLGLVLWRVGVLGVVSETGMELEVKAMGAVRLVAERQMCTGWEALLWPLEGYGRWWHTSTMRGWGR